MWYAILVVVAIMAALLFDRWFLGYGKPKRDREAENKIYSLEVTISSLKEKQASMQACIDMQSKELDDRKAKIESLESNNTSLVAQLSKALTQRAEADKKLDEQKNELALIQYQMKTEFQNLANAIMEEKSAKFTAMNKENLDTLLKPLQDRLSEFKSTVTQTHESQTRDGATLRQQIAHLTELNTLVSKEANNLTAALKGQNKTAGNWGELILETVLQNSGLTRGQEFLVQESFTSDAGNRLQPDVIINLPEKKHLVVDSKVSLVAYERYCSCENGEAYRSGEHLKDHIASLRAHIDGLAAKRYQDLYQINTPDFVILFVAIDPALVVALQNDPKLYTDAFERGICLVSPATLMFTLRTVANLWRRQKQESNAMEIAKRGGALYDKFVTFFMRMQSLGDSIAKSHTLFDDAMGQLKNGKGSLVRQAEQMRELGARTSKVLPEGVLVETE